MNKKIIEDMIPNNKRSNLEKEQLVMAVDTKSKSKPLKSYRKNEGRFKKIFWRSIAVICIIFIFFSSSYVFSKAEILIKPKKIPIQVNHNFKSYRQGSTDEMEFKIITITYSKSLNGFEYERSTSQSKATGTIVVYNNTSAPQILVSGTRFENTKKLIYKISKTITIPAAKMVGGKKVSGSYEIKVEAAEPGKEYNFRLDDLIGEFSIPGLKNNTYKYQNIIARAKTDFTGGEKMDIKIKENVALGKTEKNIKQEILSEALGKLKSDVPEGYVVFDGSIIVGELNFEVSSSKIPELIGKMTLSAPIFSKQELLTQLVNKTNIKQSIKEGTKLDSSDVSNLKFTFSEKVDKLEQKELIIFRLEGAITAYGLTDINIIKQKIAGMHIKDINTSLGEFREIEKADILVTPRWKKTIPLDQDKIKIIQLGLD